MSDGRWTSPGYRLSEVRCEEGSITVVAVVTEDIAMTLRNSVPVKIKRKTGGRAKTVEIPIEPEHLVQGDAIELTYTFDRTNRL